MIIILKISQMLVAHTCNPSYSGGRHQEDYGLISVRANSLWDPISKKTHLKKRWWSDSRCRPWVQTPVWQREKKYYLAPTILPCHHCVNQNHVYNIQSSAIYICWYRYTRKEIKERNLVQIRLQEKITESLVSHKGKSDLIPVEWSVK
jgi:hypothetical protein